VIALSTWLRIVKEQVDAVNLTRSETSVDTHQRGSTRTALCQIVTAAPDEPACQRMLEELERTNLFVVPLDEQQQ